MTIRLIERYRMLKEIMMRYSILTILILLLAGHQIGMTAPKTVNKVSSSDLSSGSGLENLGGGLLEGLLEDLDGELPPIAPQQEVDPAPNPGERLPEQRLPEQRGLRQRPTPNQPKSSKQENEKSWLPKTEQLRRQMDQQLGGEDVGQPQPSPLTPIAQRMQSAAELISTSGEPAFAGKTKPVQKQVVADLDSLIAQMEKECQGGGECKPKPKSEKQASKRSQPKPSKSSKPGKPSGKPSQAAAKDSTTRMGSAPVATANGQSPEDLMKAAWGHLPARLREQMVQSSSDEFLPEYQEELEKYFQRLAEREAAEANE